MATGGIFRRVDAVTVPVPDLDAGLRYYSQALGHRLLWRNDAAGQAGLALPDGDSELVLTTRQRYEPNWLVDNVDDAVETLRHLVFVHDSWFRRCVLGLTEPFTPMGLAPPFVPALEEQGLDRSARPSLD